MSEDGTLVLLSPLRARAEAELYNVNDGHSISLGLRAAPLLLSADGVAFGVTATTAAKTTLKRVVDGASETLGELLVGPDQLELKAATPDGSLILGYMHHDDGIEPFRWSEATGLVVGFPGLPAETPNAVLLRVSRDGGTLAGYLGGEDQRFPKAFVWTEADGLTEIAAGANWRGQVPLLSDDGSVAVATLDLGLRTYSASRWTRAGGSVALIPALGHIASVMNADGSVIAGHLEDGAATTEDDAPYVWTAETGERYLKDLLEEDGADLTNLSVGAPITLSRDGKIVVGHATCNGRPALYRMELPD